MIPSQDKLISYLEGTQEPVKNDPFESQFKTNLLTTRDVRERTRKNLRELQQITGENFNIVI